jgi:hypothetical protein
MPYAFGMLQFLQLKPDLGERRGHSRYPPLLDYPESTTRGSNFGSYRPEGSSRDSGGEGSLNRSTGSLRRLRYSSATHNGRVLLLLQVHHTTDGMLDPNGEPHRDHCLGRKAVRGDP